MFTQLTPLLGLVFPDLPLAVDDVLEGLLLAPWQGHLGRKAAVGVLLQRRGVVGPVVEPAGDEDLPACISTLTRYVRYGVLTDCGPGPQVKVAWCEEDMMRYRCVASSGRRNASRY